MDCSKLYQDYFNLYKEAFKYKSASDIQKIVNEKWVKLKSALKAGEKEPYSDELIRQKNLKNQRTSSSSVTAFFAKKS